MKKFAMAAAVVCALSVHADQVLESIEVRVVEVDVVVLDKAGKPVSGLGRDDFELLVDGRPRPISNFYAAERTTLAEAAPAQQGAVAEPPQHRRTYVTVFADLAHLRQQSLRRSLDALRAFVKTLPPNASLQLVSWNGSLNIEKPFFGAKTIDAAVEDLIGRPTGMTSIDLRRRDLLSMIDQSHTEAGGIHQGTMLNPRKVEDEVRAFAREEHSFVERTIDALGEVARSSAGLQGRRILIYLSDGLPTQPGIELFDYNHMAGIDTGEYDVTAKLKSMARDSAAQGVMIYSLDASGLRNREDTGIEHEKYISRVDSTLTRFNNQSALQFLAEETGGRAILNSNDMTAAFAELREHATTYYSIGFRGDGLEAVRSVRVNVRRPGLTVRSPRTFREQTAEQELTSRVRASLYSREQVNPLDVRIGIGARGKKPAINLVIAVPQEKLASITGMTSGYDMYVCILNEKLEESEVKKLHRDVLIPSDGMRPISIPSDPGSYVVSIAVVDSLTGEASYLQHEVTVAP